MSYLNAVKGNKGPGSHSHPAPTQVVVPEKNEPVEPVVEDEVEEQVPEKAEENVQETFAPSTQVTRVGNKKYTGRWARLEFEDEEKENDFWRVFALAAGPGGLCNFALTCTYFFDKLLTPDMWALVQHLLPPVLIPSIHLKIETSIESGSAEKTQTVPITSLKQNYQIIQLLTYWNRILSKAEEEREKAKQDDPTLGKESLNATLNGGFAIETVSEKKNNSLCYLQDLKLVISVTNAVKQLIFRTNKSVKIPYRNGNITLALYGRGGTHVSFNVKAGKENVRAIFPLDVFANQIRKAAKKFIPLAGSCRIQLQKQRNNISPDNTNSFQEKEQWILKTLEHEALASAVKDLRSHLAHGVVPGSQLPEHFQKKTLQKNKKQSQMENENSNIMDLILENLPPHFDDAKKAAKRLEEAAISQRDDEEKDRQARFEAKKLEREREKEEKKKLAEAEKQGKTLEQAKEEIQAQVAKKPKTKVVTKKDDEGYNVKVVVDKKSGTEIKEKETKAPEPKEVETTPEKAKSKSKKKTAASEQPDDSNVFSMADEYEGVPSPNDYQISLREAKQKGMEKNQQSKKKYPTPAPKPGDKEKKAKEKAEKKAKEEKVAAQKVPKKQVALPVVQSTDVPFFQNELVKPLVYVVALVSLLSVIYLIMS
jgi:hypothetical protein